MITKRAGSSASTMLVTFQLPSAIAAQEVHQVGDFNGWDRRSLPLQHLARDGVWEISLELERSKAFHFRYLVNGSSWHNDWNADRYAANPFGGENSVVET